MNKPYVNHLGRKHQITRMLWSICWSLLATWIPRSLLSGWKRFLLRFFGAKIHPTAIVYSTAKIYYPANLYMDEFACIASDVDCYNVAPISVGKFATVSQGVFLCTATHDIDSENHELITKPINIGKNAWIGAKAYVGPGVNIGDYAVVGATASVYKDVEPYNVVGGNPAKYLKMRILNTQMGGGIESAVCFHPSERRVA